MMEEGVRLFSAKSGALTASVGGRLLHSKHDPAREARRVTAELARREPPAVVFLGLGLGYQVAALLSETKRTKVLVFEPSEKLIAASRKQGIIGDDARLHIAPTPQALDGCLSLHAKSGYALLTLQNRFGEHDERHAAAKRVIDAFASRLEINLNTLHRFGRLWVRNLCRNLPVMLGATGVSSLSNLFPKVPALILAAGPTLDQVLPVLPQLAERMVVIAVDTAVGPAIAAGVEPDFAVVVDPQYWNARHLDRVTCSTAILVSESSAHPYIFRSFRPPYVFCSSVFPLAKRYEEALGRFGSLGAGGSVSTSAWDLARELGCGNAFVAGLDLGFPQGRTHCRGSFFEELAVAVGTRTRTGEAVVFRYVNSADPHAIPSNDGDQILSDKRMDIYRAWFESQLVAGELPTASITNGGAHVNGISVVGVKRLTELPVVRPLVDERLAQLRERGHEHSPTRARGLAQVTATLIDNLRSLRRIAASAVDAIEGVSLAYEQAGRVDFGPLEAIDRALLHHPASEIAGFLLQHAISEIDQGFGSRDIGEQLEASRLLYRQLLEATEFHLQELQTIQKDIKKQ